MHSPAVLPDLSPKEIIMSVLTGLIAIAGIITAIAAIRQARAVERSNEAFRASQAIAERQARAVEVSNEAFLEAQKISVTPHLDIEHSSSKLGRVGFELSNNGLGPAEMVRFTIYLDGKPVDSSGDYAGWLSAGRQLKVKADFAEVGAPGVGSWIRSGQSMILFKVSERVDPDEAVAEFNRIKEHIGFQITYRSRFGEEKTLERNLGQQQD